MDLAIILLLGCVIILLIVLVIKIDIVENRAVQYVRVVRRAEEFYTTKARFKELGYEISEVRETPSHLIIIIFVKVK